MSLVWNGSTAEWSRSRKCHVHQDFRALSSCLLLLRGVVSQLVCSLWVQCRQIEQLLMTGRSWLAGSTDLQYRETGRAGGRGTCCPGAATAQRIYRKDLKSCSSGSRGSALRVTTPLPASWG